MACAQFTLAGTSTIQKMWFAASLSYPWSGWQVLTVIYGLSCFLAPPLLPGEGIDKNSWIRSNSFV